MMMHKIVATILLLLPMVSAQSGLTFSDLFNTFKTGIVDNIFGNWFLAGLGLTAIAIWLGISLGVGVDGVIIFTIPLIFIFVTTSILPTTVSIVLSIIVTVLIYIIYIRLFKR